MTKNADNKHSGSRDPRVEAILHTLPTWQYQVAQRVRDLVLAADPQVEETVKRTNRPYYVLQGNICALLGAKDHLNVFIYDPTAPDPEHIINQGQGNLTARAIQIYEGDPLNERALTSLIRDVIANNRAGGWRNIQKRP